MGIAESRRKGWMKDEGRERHGQNEKGRPKGRPLFTALKIRPKTASANVQTR